MMPPVQEGTQVDLDRHTSLKFDFDPAVRTSASCLRTFTNPDAAYQGERTFHVVVVSCPNRAKSGGCPCAVVSFAEQER